LPENVRVRKSVKRPGEEELKIIFKTGKKFGSENAVVNRVMNLRIP